MLFFESIEVIAMGKIRNFFDFLTLFFFLIQVGIVFILNYIVEDV